LTANKQKQKTGSCRELFLKSFWLNTYFCGSAKSEIQMSGV